MKIRLLGVILIIGLVGLSRAQSTGQRYIVALRGGGSIGAVNADYGTIFFTSRRRHTIYLVQSGTPDVNAQVLQQLHNDSSVASAELNTSVRLRYPSDATLNPALVQQAAS